jgi:hypothetical protein
VSAHNSDVSAHISPGRRHRADRTGR